MSFIQQFFTSRDNNANAETFVGQEGRLWWDPVTNQIYSSDGSTPGGIPLAGGGGGNGSPGGSNSQVQFNNSGTFGGSANLTFNRVNGALTAVSFVGNGSALTNITGANVTGTVASATSADSATSATTAGTVTTNAQPNITSVGTLTSVTSSGNISATGNVTGNYFIGNGSQLTGISSSSNRIFNGTSNVEIATADGNATITAAGTSTWTFDTVGTLNLPGGNIVQAVDNDLNIVVQDADNDDFALQLIVDDGAGTPLSRIQQQRDNIQLAVGLGGSPYYWEFDSGGTLRLPGDVWGNAGGNLTVQIPISDANSFISLQTRDNTDTIKSNINVTTTNVTISTNTVGNTWVFDSVGNLTLPGGGSIYHNENYTIITGVAGSELNWAGVDSGATVGAEDTAAYMLAGSASGTSNVVIYPNSINATSTGNINIISNANTWTFDTVGNLTLPSNTASINYANGTPYGGSGGASLPLANGTSNFDIATANGNATITTNGANTWTFDTTGTLTVPTIATGDGTSEVSAVSGSRKIIGSVNTWSTYIDGHSAFGALAWTASSSAIQSAKITFAVQTNGTAYNWEQFDVAICRLDGANAYVSVSGRVRQNSVIDYTEVSGYVSGGSLQVWLNPADGQTSAYVNYHSVEFNIMPD